MKYVKILFVHTEIKQDLFIFVLPQIEDLKT